MSAADDRVARIQRAADAIMAKASVLFESENKQLEEHEAYVANFAALAALAAASLATYAVANRRVDGAPATASFDAELANLSAQIAEIGHDMVARFAADDAPRPLQ